MEFLRKWKPSSPSTSTPNLDESDLGLLLVSPSKETTTTFVEYSTDLVAIHGLSGHRMKTWTADNGRFWLKEFLLSELPYARIFTFGYNSELTFSKSAATIDDFAIGLLDELDNFRTNPEVLLCCSG
jgi:hypothetical protein